MTCPSLPVGETDTVFIIQCYNNYYKRLSSVIKKMLRGTEELRLKFNDNSGREILIHDREGVNSTHKEKHNPEWAQSFHM